MTARTTVTNSGPDAGGADGTSEAVIRAVAEAKGVDPVELDPLYDRIDLDAVDRLFASTDVPAGRLTFDVAGCRVRVRADGQVSATPLEDADRADPE